MPEVQSTAGDLTNRAVEAIDALIHVTDRSEERPDHALPAGVHEVVEGLTALTGLLPTLLHQMSLWLEAEGEAGRFLINGLPVAGVDAGLTAAARLHGARECAADLNRQVSEAHAALSALDRR